MATLQDLTLDLTQSIEIDADVDASYDAVIRRLTVDSSTPENKPMPMVLEQWPGGRWFRDLGDGQGHLWGFVQVIKPPTLIEIHGPMFMSYAVAGHIQLQLSPSSAGTELSVRHRVLGVVDDKHREGLSLGWQHFLSGVKEMAASVAT